MSLVRFRSEGSSVELYGLSSASVSLGQTPRAENPRAASARPPSPSENRKTNHKTITNLMRTLTLDLTMVTRLHHHVSYYRYCY